MAVFLGLAGMIVACAAAWRWGARPERLGAALLAVAWAAVLACQLVFGDRRMEPIIIGDCVYGAGLLVISGLYWRIWSWISVALEAVAFFLHAMLYQGIVSPSYVYAASLNTISWLELAVLLAAALINRGRGRREASR